MDHARYHALERMAEEKGCYRSPLVDVDEWRHGHELAHGTLRGSPDFRNMDAATRAGMYRDKGWTVVTAIRTNVGHLGPRQLSAVERLALRPKSAWTMVPVEDENTLLLAFSDAADAEPFLALDTRRRLFAYHATQLEALDGIREHGLVPNDGTRGFWPDGYDVLGKLFFCTTQDGAEYYADAIDRNVGQSALLRFPLCAERRHDARTDSGDGWWIATSVPADCIEVMEDGAWKALAPC